MQDKITTNKTTEELVRLLEEQNTFISLLEELANLEHANYVYSLSKTTKQLTKDLRRFNKLKHSLVPNQKIIVEELKKDIWIREKG